MSRTPPSRKRTMRGQPLLVLIVLVVGWSLVRAATWSSPVPEAVIAAMPIGTVQAAGAATERQDPGSVAQLASPDGTDSAAWRAPLVPVAPVPAVAQPPIVQLPSGPAVEPPPLAAANGAPPRRTPVSPRLAAGHAMLMAAGFAQMRIPPEIAAFFERRDNSAPAKLAQAPSVPAAAPVALTSGAASTRQSRWSADGWLMWRDDTTTPITSGRPSYGRSQAGAVIRYELAPGSARSPQAYLRGSAALQGAPEREVAAGLSARPLARVPLRAAAELRASDRATGIELRPAAYVVTELTPQSLPAGLAAEGYAQAGYVGGRVHTAFVDGQARLDGSLASAADFDLRAGAAAWGGAQREGARLDVGPTASVGFQLGATRGRLAADYRFRVAGDAEPASGPAITLSAGF